MVIQSLIVPWRQPRSLFVLSLTLLMQGCCQYVIIFHHSIPIRTTVVIRVRFRMTRSVEFNFALLTMLQRCATRESNHRYWCSNEPDGWQSLVFWSYCYHSNVNRGLSRLTLIWRSRRFRLFLCLYWRQNKLQIWSGLSSFLRSSWKRALLVLPTAEKIRTVHWFCTLLLMCQPWSG